MSNPTDPQDPAAQRSNPYGPQGQYPNQGYPNQQGQYPTPGQSQNPYAQGQNPYGQGQNLYGQGQSPSQYPNQQGQYPGQGSTAQGYGNQQGQYPTPGQQYVPSGQYPNQPGQGARPAGYGTRPGAAPYGASSAGGPASGGSNKKLLAIVGGVIALALIATIIGLAARHKSTPAATGTSSGAATSGDGSASSSGSAAAPADSAKAAVQGYLKALQDGNSAAALSYAKTDPTDKTFLTDDILKQGTKAAPISDITVSGDDNPYDFATVDYSYKQAGRQVNDQISASKINGAWKLSDVVGTMSIYSGMQNGAPMYIAGKKVDADKVYLFPGTYAVTANSKLIGYGTGKVTVEKPGDYVSTTGLDLALTSDGKTAVINAAKAKWASCLAQHSIAPAGCGFAVGNSKHVKFQTSSIKWTVSSGSAAMNTLQPKLDYNDATLATAYVYMSMNFAAKDTAGNPYTGYSSVSEMDAKLSGDKVSVTFD